MPALPRPDDALPDIDLDDSRSDIPLADEEPPPRRPSRLEDPPLELSDAPEGRQITLAGTLALVAAASVLLGIARLMSAPWIAATLGLLSLAGMLLMSFLPVSRLEVRLAWWVILLLYLTACIAAFLSVAV